jgi:hypothetical protein
MVCRSLHKLPFFIALPNVSLDLAAVQSIDRGTWTQRRETSAETRSIYLLDARNA